MTDDERMTGQESSRTHHPSDDLSEPASTVEVIPADINLKMKMGGRPGRRGQISADAIAKAEKAVKKVGENYIEVGRSQVATLIGQFAAVRANPKDARSAITQVAMTAREIMGQAKSCGSSLLTNVAESLYKFLADRSSLGPKEMAFAEAHLGVMQNVVAHDLGGDGGPVGKELLQSLAIAKQKLTKT